MRHIVRGYGDMVMQLGAPHPNNPNALRLSISGPDGGEHMWVDKTDLVTIGLKFIQAGLEEGAA